MSGQAVQTKPAYIVPSMAEIEAIPWNGFNVVSTFSGCGGSCLGFRMAGFRTLWASEFIPAAQEVYRLNHPGTYLDTRDIRQVQPADILEQIGLEVGQVDVLEGSPPCASFSTAGKREAGWGQVKPYSDTKQRVDDLFFEFARILEGLQPRVFVAENVSGLVKGKAKGYFKEILAALKACGYNVKARLLNAQWLGVPQMRQRLIFVGVRNDLGIEPAHPVPLAYQYTVAEAIGADIGREYDEQIIGNDAFKPKWGSLKNVHPTILQAGIHGGSGELRNSETLEKRKFSIAELKRICAFPDDFQLVGTYSQQWERLGRAVPPVMMRHIAETVRDEILCKI